MSATHKIFDFKFSASYPTGGEVWSPGAGILGSPAFVVLPIPKAGYVFEFDYAAGKLKAYRQTAATGPLVEVPNATDLSSAPGTIQVLVLDRS
jgi:hypothetical protein